jgi:hypothetical protein
VSALFEILSFPVTSGFSEAGSLKTYKVRFQLLALEKVS